MTIFIGLASCNDKKDILEINTNTNPTDHNSILFLVESANVPILKDSVELKRFLTPGQMNVAFDSMTDSGFDPPVFRKLEFKDYGTIIKTKYYQTDLLLLIDNEKHGRFYSFTLNSYDKDRNKVGHLDFASWTDESHWSGKIKGDTIVEIKCDETGEQRQFKIADNGEFVLLNSNIK
ncbi:MAG TPA: hypothetical protein VI731_01835 [Bacteroidia bacterium]|nr:hypothetical protein [Bacteroidia bacterium]